MAKQSKLRPRDMRSQARMDNLAYLSQIILKSTGAGIYISQGGIFVYVSPLIEEFSGYTKTELLGMHCFDLVYPADRDMVRTKAIENLKNPLNSPYEYRFMHKNGTTAWVIERVTSIEYCNERAVMGSIMDITEKKRIEVELSRSEEKFRTILERMQDAYFELDLSGNFTYVNFATRDSVAYSKEELIGKNYRLVTPMDEYDKVFIAFSEVYRTQVPNKAFSHRFLQKDGGILFAESSIDLCRDEKGQITGFRCVSRDVTERRQLEEELRQSEERYRAILEEMEDAYHEVDLAGNFTFVNDSTCRYTGYPRDELLGMNYRKTAYKDDINLIYGFYNHTYRTGEPNKGFSHRMVRKDGSIRFIEAAISLMKNKQGGAVGFRSVSRDVTERKRLEEALARSEETYRTILEQMQDAYYEIDAAGIFLFANEATCLNLGIPLNKLIGTNLNGLVPEDERLAVTLAYKRVLETGNPNRAFSHRVILPGGKIAFAEVSISPLKNKQGNTIGFRCVGRDVTERKQMEQLLANMATHDFLTELPNRVLLIDRFDIALAQAHRKERKVAIMSLDLDRFKEVNDTLGHSVGDGVLKQVALKLAATVRSSDTVARLGGDEFLLLLQEIHEIQDATIIADKILRSLEEALVIEGRSLVLSASIGIAIYPDDGKDLETLMKKSDASMYYSKRNGGCQYRVYCDHDRNELNN